jgi:hypothetical protein
VSGQVVKFKVYKPSGNSTKSAVALVVNPKVYELYTFTSFKVKANSNGIS